MRKRFDAVRFMWAGVLLVMTVAGGCALPDVRARSVAVEAGADSERPADVAGQAELPTNSAQTGSGESSSTKPVVPIAGVATSTTSVGGMGDVQASGGKAGVGGVVSPEGASGSGGHAGMGAVSSGGVQAVRGERGGPEPAENAGRAISVAGMGAGAPDTTGCMMDVDVWYDSTSGLLWQVMPTALLTWAEASAHCDALAL